MNRRSLFPLVIAVMAALIYFFVLNLAQGNLAKSQKMETVAVAGLDLPEGTQLKRTHIRTAEIPLSYIQKDAYVLSKGANLSDIENLVTRVSIAKGNQITKPSLSSLSPEMGISLKVQPGNRAYILEVKNQVAKMIKPGDKVDILITFDAQLKNSNKEKMSVIILQNILVLGVGSNLGQGLDSAAKNKNKEDEQNSAAFSDMSTLSLSLGLEAPQYLALAEEEGEITVVVRAPGDMNENSVPITSFSSLFN
ncbi:MAG: Flp pilus assembly protein CpaB [Elusimicrobiaceae bacterium]|nr:Flp pilus assembly protein CpaB [Elusimicrobiaceae bacterium]